MVGEIQQRPGRATPATTGLSREVRTLLGALEDGQLFWFADWPVAAVPRSGALVYTVWNRSGEFIYVGMAGRGETSTARGPGPFGRLNSHASGRRSGDQFCIYICDRLVLPTVRDRIDDVAAGRFWLDQATRDYVRTELGFRVVEVTDGREALRVARLVQRGSLAAGRPLLNRSREVIGSFVWRRWRTVEPIHARQRGRTGCPPAPACTASRRSSSTVMASQARRALHPGGAVRPLLEQWDLT